MILQTRCIRSQANILKCILLTAAFGVTNPVFADQSVKLQFSAEVDGQPFTCGQQYTGIGATDSTITPSDFRLYLSAVELLDSDGRVVPVTLEQDGIWQYQDVALLDFEDGSGPCQNGNTPVNMSVHGTVPDGNYQGVQFTLGLPFALNHTDNLLAPSPLNLSAMFWNWQGGYRFFKVDISTSGESEPGRVMAGAAQGRQGQGGGMHAMMHGAGEGAPGNGGRGMMHGAGEGAQGNGGRGMMHGAGEGGQGQGGMRGMMAAAHGGGGSSGYLIHLGSTGCASATATTAPTQGCMNPNLVAVSFTSFDPAVDTIVIDIAPLLQNSDLGFNTPGTPPGCMSGINDPECASIFEGFGLAGSEQKLFRVK